MAMRPLRKASKTMSEPQKTNKASETLRAALIKRLGENADLTGDEALMAVKDIVRNEPDAFDPFNPIDKMMRLLAHD